MRKVCAPGSTAGGRSAAWGWLLLSFLAGSISSPGHADEIPAYQVLSCERDCPKIVYASLLKQSPAEYPFKDRGATDVYVEALVDVDFTIATDGSVKNAFVEFLLGPHEFADSALKAVNSRLYNPATEDAKPVEENHRVRFQFVVNGVESEARERVAKDYERAIRLARDQKIDDAIAGLNTIAAEPSLNFYERTMVGYARAVLDHQKGDRWAAREAIRTATIDEGKYLDKHKVIDALRLRVALEAETGELADAFAWYEILQKQTSLDANDQTTQLVAKLHAMLDNSEPIGIDAKIANTGTPTLWQHTLLRRSFEFKNIEGALDHFTLNCARHSIRSIVSTSANWTVPQSWPSCIISVFGDPGTNFRFVEFRPDAK
jgi:TonB-like protein